MNFPSDTHPGSLSARVATRFAPPQLEPLVDWQVIRHLGSGSTAHVWLLQHRTTMQHIACKTPKDVDDVPNLSHEAELANSLAHENLIQHVNIEAIDELETVDAAAGTFWEYLPAGSLAEVVAANGQLPLAQVVTVVLPMVQVAQYLHSRQIVHGDISPRNILFDLSGRPVLIDLGSTRASAHAFHLAGAPGFSAPELEGAPEDVEGLGAAADVYSLAAIAWFCLTGLVPGPAYARVPLMTLQPALDEDIVEMLEACLVEEPVLRPTMEQLLASVTHWADPEPIDLFAVVDEEYELLLPTRKPESHSTTPRRKFKRLRTRNTKHSARAQHGPGKKRRTRILLAVGSLVLTAGVVATSVFGTQGSPNSRFDPRDELSPQPAATDFQAVVDSLAKARTEAWAAPDPSLVARYAVRDSSVFENDYGILESLAAEDHRLDGIRMRAVVESAETTAEGALVDVEWRVDGYSQMDAVDTTVEEFASQSVPLQLRLVTSEGEWKIAETASR
ncbi:MAG: protein kinase [Micrococcaceae bacterium]|nr:protein kinase [Micrococcaceae bacterium]